MREYSWTFRRDPISKKKPSFGIFGLLIIVIGFLFIGYFSVSSVWNYDVPSGVYRISKGDTIGNIPKSFDFDIAAWRYRLWIKFFAPEVTNLQVWEYRINEPVTLRLFFSDSLSNPVHTDQTITILPGWNIYDIDDYLARKELIAAGEFITETSMNLSTLAEEFSFLVGKDSLEWFLYPDTYRIRVDATPLQIARILLAQFEKRVGPTYEELWEDAYRELILASIVEREERVSSEQPIVAWVLSKRVNEWIPMWADATVCTWYAKTQKQCTPSFIAQVIYDRHPFNTRNKQGYPPTPISNVPVDTWENTLAKKESPYYYYLHDSTGQIHYGKTLEEHNANKRQYLQ